MLVSIEGIDGSGKTTVWEVLRDRYGSADGDGAGAGSGAGDPETDAGEDGGATTPSAGAGVTFTREPTETWYGEAVRRSVGDEAADPVAELFLFTADHAAHLSRTVRPALEAGDVVVSDRYVDSRYAYQSVALEDVVPRPLEYIRGVHGPWTREPDLTLYLDVDPETGAARSGATDKLEQAAFLAEVRARYERLVAAEPGRFVRIDADRPPEAVLERVESVLAERVPGLDTGREGADTGTGTGDAGPDAR